MNEGVLTLTADQMAEVVRIAAGVGATTAMERFQEAREQEAKEWADNRLRNIKLLLRNYRLFKAHVANAVYDPETDLDPMAVIRDLMMPGKSPNLVVESIKNSATRTALIVDHIDKMIRVYEAYCQSTNAADDLRRWRVIQGMYISEDKLTVAELAARENVAERTVYKDIDAACDIIAPLVFGVDGMRKR